MADKDPKSPATTSLAYDEMLPKWDKMSTLLGGTEAMRAAGQLYLPQHPAETDQAYRERLQVTTLTNFVDMTLTSLVSRPFSAPISIGEDVPEDILAILPDVDMQGTSLDRFSRAWFREGLAMTVSAVLVEYPRINKSEDRTLADDRRENLRPYLVRISPENIISVDHEIRDGVEFYTEVRIRTTLVVKDGYAQREVEQIRVLSPGHVQVFELRKTERNRQEWVLVDEYDVDLNFIPIVFFYADRTGLMTGKPPLLDLANLNIRHWQSTSDQISVLTVARFPMLAVSGSLESSEVIVGPNRVLSVTDPSGRYYYVEHTGRAIAAGEKDLLALEEVMAEYGATFLKKRPGGATATARALDSAEVTSALQDMALGFQDCLNQVMYYVAFWMGKRTGPNPGGTFKVKTDFSLSDTDTASLTALQAARANADISRYDYLKMLVRFGVIPDDFPFDENEKRLADEQVEKNKQLEFQAKTEAAARPKPVGAQ